MDSVQIVSHWDKYFDGLQYSSQAFYSALDDALASRSIPGAVASRVELAEGAAFSAKREYLRVRREKYTFNICAAPFGSGFFVSWWLTKPSRRGLFYALLLVLVCALFFGSLTWFGVLAVTFNVLFAAAGTVALVLAGLGVVGGVVRLGLFGIEDEVIAFPLIGAIYEWVYRPFTYYRLDTMRMFESAVHAALLEVIDGMTSTQGVRALSEFERKPIMRELLSRRVA